MLYRKLESFIYQNFVVNTETLCVVSKATNFLSRICQEVCYRTRRFLIIISSHLSLMSKSYSLIMPNPRIIELASRIATNTSKLSEYLAANNLPQPSFHLDTPPYGPVPKDAPPEIIDLRQSVLDDTAELQLLMLGPRDYLFSNFVVINLMISSSTCSKS